MPANMPRLIILVFMFSVVFGGSGLAQRDPAVTDCYLAQLKLYHAKKSQTTVDVIYVHSGGPHEHTHRQAWLLVYPKKNEAKILELASQAPLSEKQVPSEKVERQVLANTPQPDDLPFFAELKKRKLAVPIATKTATWTDTNLPTYLPKGVNNTGFPFRFDLDNQTVFDAVYQLGGCDKSNRIEYGEPTTAKWFKDRFKLILFVPVNDSGYAQQIPVAQQKFYDFASEFDYQTVFAYFRPLPWELTFVWNNQGISTHAK